MPFAPNGSYSAARTYRTYETYECALASSVSCSEGAVQRSRRRGNLLPRLSKKRKMANGRNMWRSVKTITNRGCPF
jgi:hypothetical protein